MQSIINFLTEGTLDIVYDKFLEFLSERYNFDKPIDLTIKKETKQKSFGHTTLKPAKRYKIVVEDGSLGLVLSRIVHEFSHIRQIDSGRLSIVRDRLVWCEKEF